MITLQDVISRFNHHVTGGDKFQWAVFGANARFMDFKNSYVVFDSIDQTIYEIGCHPSNYGDTLDSIYWINPQYEVAYRVEQTNRKLTPADTGSQAFCQEAMMRMCETAEREHKIDPDLLLLIDLDLPADLMADLRVIANAKMISVERLVEQFVTEFATKLVETMPEKKKKKKKIIWNQHK